MNVRVHRCVPQCGSVMRKNSPAGHDDEHTQGSRKDDGGNIRRVQAIAEKGQTSGLQEVSHQDMAAL